MSLLIEANDILARKREIKTLVATANLDLAVRRCIDFYQDFGIEDDAAVLLSMRFYNILEKERKGLWTQEVVARQKAQIASSILQLIKDFSTFIIR